jgi:hypothetical protein
MICVLADLKTLMLSVIDVCELESDSKRGEKARSEVMRISNFNSLASANDRRRRRSALEPNETSLSFSFLLFFLSTSTNNQPTTTNNQPTNSNPSSKPTSHLPSAAEAAGVATPSTASTATGGALRRRTTTGTSRVRSSSTARGLTGRWREPLSFLWQEPRKKDSSRA